MTSSDLNRLLPEQRARVRIDGMLAAVGWIVQDYKAVNLYAGTGVAVRNSRDPNGPVLVYTRAEIEAFILGVRDGDFDHLVP